MFLKHLYLLCAVFLHLLVCEFSKQYLHLPTDSATNPFITSKVNISSYVWPFPTTIKCTENAYFIRNNEMHFALMEPGLFPNAHPILFQAFDEYHQIILNQIRQIPDTFQHTPELSGVLLEFIQLNVTLNSDDVSLTFDMKEDYTLSIEYPASTLIASTVYGALRGIETFSQMILEYSDSNLYLHQCEVTDTPYFKYRGILYETSHHFLPVPLLKRHIDAMAWNKFNVFHWHIVDIPAFPYVSTTFPEMSAKGAYSPRHIYTKSDVQEVISYANQHGIRVIAEFDTPGHTDSWGRGQPNLLTPCYTNGKPDGTYGPINAISNATWPFLRALFAEVVQDFRDPYIHLGGDEVNFRCWESNPDIQQWMRERGYTRYAKFEEFYMAELIGLVEQLNKRYVVWQDVFDNGIKLKADTIIQVWNGGLNWTAEVRSVTGAGHQTILSSCWYLDLVSPSDDFYGYFRCDPHSFGGSSAQQKLVLGGEAAIWSRYMDGTNSLSRTWPRACPTAERLWTGPSTVGISDREIHDRLQKQRCRLLNRELPAEPIEFGHCTYPWLNLPTF